MILGCPRAKQGLCHYDIWGGDPSLIRYSYKTAEQNFMKLSGIVHYMMPYCTSFFKFYSNDFRVSQSKTRTLPYKTWGSGGYHFVSIAHSISSFHINFLLSRSGCYGSHIQYSLYYIGFSCEFLC